MRHRTKTLLPAALLITAAAAAGAAFVLQDRGASSDQEFLTVPELIEAALPIVDDPKRAILDDGVITLGEYDSAVEQVISCIERGGLRVNRLPGRGVGGALQFTVEGDLRTTTAQAATDLHMGCQERFVGELNLISAAQNRPTAPQIAARESDFDGCVSANGFPQFVGDRGELATPGRLAPMSRAQLVYFGCLQNGADWKLPRLQ